MATGFRYMAGIAAVFSFALSTATMAQQLLDSYIAVIGPQDRFNSSGTALTQVGQILAQDRANFHRFGIRQQGDTADRTFLTTEGRASIPALLGGGFVDPAATRAILGEQDAPVLVEVLGSDGRVTGLRVTLATGVQQQQALPGMSAPPMSDLTWNFGRYPADLASIASADLYRGQDLLVSLRCIEANGAQPAPVAGIDPTPGVVTLHLGPQLAGSGAEGQAITAELALGQSDRFDLPFEWRAPPGAFSADLVLVPAFVARLAEGRVVIGAAAQPVDFAGSSGLNETMAQLSQACMSQATVAARGCAHEAAGADLVQCILPDSARGAEQFVSLEVSQTTGSVPQTGAAPMADREAKPAEEAVRLTTVPSVSDTALAQDISTVEWRCPSYGLCWDSNGNRMRLSETQYNTMPRHQGLRVLNCSNRALSVEILLEEIACMQRMFGLPEGPASDVDFQLMEAAARQRNLEGALQAISRIGYQVGGHDPQEAAEATQVSEPSQPVDRVPLFFPEIGQPPPGKLSAIHEGRFFNIVHVARLVSQEEVLLTNLQPNMRTQRSPHAEAYFLRQFIEPVTKLLDPVDSREDATLRPAWSKELGGDSQHARLFPEPIMSAIAAAPPILRCRYDHYSAAPSDDRDFLSSRNVNLAFWSRPVPDAISPPVLREYGGPGWGMHPLILIGPPVEACPRNLGLALETLATQFPGQVPAADPAEARPTGALTVQIGPDLSFLPRSTARYFGNILDQGRPADLDNPLHLRLTIPLAYHAAYSNFCSRQPEAALDFVYTDLFGESVAIAVAPADFASLLEATLIYEPVIQKLYDESVTKDYSFREVLSVRRGEMRDWKGHWEAVLERHGCTGEVNEQFRKGIKSELPIVEYRQGSRNVLVDFGGRQDEVALSGPIDVERSRQVGRAEAQSANDPIFTNTYPGQVLRAIAVGNFEQVPTIRSRFFSSAFDAIGEAAGVDPDDPFARMFKGIVDLEGMLSRESNVLAAYAVGRMHLLGSCGDPVTTYTQTTIYWTEYTNGLGPSQSSSRSSQADVSSKFDAIIKAHNNIETSWLLASDMATIIGRMSCDNSARTQLEDNMIAYFKRRPPVHIRPIIAD